MVFVNPVTCMEESITSERKQSLLQELGTQKCIKQELVFLISKLSVEYKILLIFKKND